MVSFADFLVIIWDFVREYFLAVLAVVVIAGYYFWNRYKKKKAAKAALPPAPSPTPEPTQVQEPAPISAPVRPPAPVEDSMEHLFDSSMYPEPSQNQNVVEKMKVMSSDIINEGASMDESLRRDFERLQEELRETHKKKVEIKEHGLKLSALYEKYKQRELHLTQMLSNIEHMLQMNEQRR